jgi:hypothetical protein
MLPFSNEDRQQFAQLIGYSLGGYSELSYVDDDAYKAAEKEIGGLIKRQTMHSTHAMRTIKLIT